MGSQEKICTWSLQMCNVCSRVPFEGLWDLQDCFISAGWQNCPIFKDSFKCKCTLPLVWNPSAVFPLLIMHVAFRCTARVHFCTTCALPVRGAVVSDLLSRLRVLIGGFFCPSAFPWLSLLTGLVNQRCNKHQTIPVKLSLSLNSFSSISHSSVGGHLQRVSSSWDAAFLPWRTNSTPWRRPYSINCWRCCAWRNMAGGIRIETVFWWLYLEKVS